MTRLAVLSLWHVVEMIDTQTVLPSGIALPDTYWTNWNTAIVLASGPGLTLENGDVLPPMAQPGDLVLVSGGDFHALDGEGRQGFVYDLRIAAWLVCDAEDDRKDQIIPANDWVQVRYDERPTMSGSIHLPEKTKRRRQGVVVDTGPGRLIVNGRNRGTRLTVDAICGENLVGRRVYWSEKHAECMCVGRTSLEYLLVKAEDVLCAEAVPTEVFPPLGATLAGGTGEMAEGTSGKVAVFCSTIRAI